MDIIMTLATMYGHFILHTLWVYNEVLHFTGWEEGVTYLWFPCFLLQNTHTPKLWKKTCLFEVSHHVPSTIPSYHNADPDLPPPTTHHPPPTTMPAIRWIQPLQPWNHSQFAHLIIQIAYTLVTTLKPLLASHSHKTSFLINTIDENTITEEIKSNFCFLTQFWQPLTPVGWFHLQNACPRQ